MTTTKNADSEWPRHPDGRPMKMGEMTRAQQLAVARRACKVLEAEFRSVAMQDALRKAFDEVDPGDGGAS